MEVFASTLDQIAFLFGFIIIGFLLVRLNVLPHNASAVLSKLENTVFIPALVLGTFISNFTPERIGSAWKLLLVSLGIGVAAIFFAVVVSRLITRDKYIQKIYTYGLSFSNFGFMGNAVVNSLFPIYFLNISSLLCPYGYLYIFGVFHVC